MTDFNFDFWKNLAVATPSKFEEEKLKFLLKEIQGFNTSLENKAQLEELARQLCVKTTGTALEKAKHAQNLMLESLQQLGDGWQVLKDCADSSDSTSNQGGLAKYLTVTLKK